MESRLAAVVSGLAGVLVIAYSLAPARLASHTLLLVLASVGLVAAASLRGGGRGGLACALVYARRGVGVGEAVGELLHMARRMASSSRGARIVYECDGSGPARLCVHGPSAWRLLDEIAAVADGSVVLVPIEGGGDGDGVGEAGSGAKCSVWAPGPSTAARLAVMLARRRRGCIVVDWKGILGDPPEGCDYIDLSYTVSIPKRVKRLREILASAKGRTLILVDPVELDAEAIKKLDGEIYIITTDYSQSAAFKPCSWGEEPGGDKRINPRPHV